MLAVSVRRVYGTVSGGDDCNRDSPEGRWHVTKDREGQGDAEPPVWLMEMFHRLREVRENNPLYQELFHHPIRLRENGFQMEWGAAQACVSVLRDVHEASRLAEAFSTLVALVKPRGAESLAAKVSPEGMRLLQEEWGLLDADGRLVDPGLAPVLDASLMVTANGDTVLVDPVAYSEEFVSKYAAVEKEMESAETRILRWGDRQAARERRRNGGLGEGPAR